MPERSGFPSGERGAGAERFGLPSAVRGTEEGGTLVHCARAGEHQTSVKIAIVDHLFTSASLRVDRNSIRNSSHREARRRTRLSATFYCGFEKRRRFTR